MQTSVNGDYVVVAVRDTGMGIDDDALPYIFDRFYRVDKARSDRGIGLGLSIAKKIIDTDQEIDTAEVELEEECLKIIALHQPVAVDLRFINAVVKINNDLERIGDEAVNIAERVENISKRLPLSVPFDFAAMAEKAEAMLKESLDALVNQDVDLAYKVCLDDDDVDRMNHMVYDEVKKAIKKQPDRVGYLLNLFLVARHLERIADHATNIAEEVIYMIEGIIHRHKSNNFIE